MKTKALLGVVSLLFAGSSMAATITPLWNTVESMTACDYDGVADVCWTQYGDSSQPSLAELANLVGVDDDGLEQLYKSDFQGIDSGSFDDFYTTSFILDNENEPESATISWDGLGDFISCPVCYLWVKGGAKDTASLYVFDIGGWWNGQETLLLSNFWLERGAISNIGIFGNDNGGDTPPGDDTPPPVQVPEPGTLGLLGLAAIGLGLSRRRRTKV